MAKRSAENTRIKRRYLVWLKEAKGLSDASIERAAASIDRWESATRHADFRSFHEEKARAFKRSLSGEKNPATARPLSAGTVDGVLRDLKAFFTWLADQPGYRSRLKHSDAAYLNPSRKTAKAAHGGRYRPFPSPEQVDHALRQMPATSLIERRDRAMFALLYLTGGRDGALITLRLANIDLTARCVHFAGHGVDTKNGKVFTTWFFPVGDWIGDILADWIAELRRDLLFGPGDPVFARQKMGLSSAGDFEAKGLDRVPYANAARVVAICKDSFSRAGLPPFTPHLIRKTLVNLANAHCATPEQFKAWSQNLGHEDVMTTLRSYGAVSQGRQRELLTGMAASDQAVLLDED
jgi:integrase